MKNDYRRFIRRGLVWLTILLLCSSCGSMGKFGFKKEDKKSDFFEHIVKWPEENLYNITAWHTGSLDKYNEVHSANQNMSPYSLSVGDKVLIPQSLVTNRDPMPAFTDITDGGRKRPSAIQPPGRTYHTHRVTISGESLSIIAKWFTGDLKNWEQLAAANPNLNPNRIEIGDEILIPEDMMLRKDPITKSFVNSFAPKPRKKKVVTKSAPKTVSPPPPDPVEEETDLELVPPKF